MMNIKFGTDGWRAVIAEDFTFANVARVAQATADYWKSEVRSPKSEIFGRELKVVVGYDRRFFSDRFAQTTAEVFAGNDFQVMLTPEPTPTPSVSFAVKTSERAVGGVMITASHNPPIFNGFKLKSYYGGSSDPETCKAVEGFLDRNPVRVREIRRSDPQPDKFPSRTSARRIIAALKKLVDFKLIAKSKLRFAHDALFGVGAGCFEQLLAGTTCKVTTLNGKHDVLFGGINPEPIDKNYARSQKFLRRHPHDICLVTDGDADRVGGMDGRGNVSDDAPDHLPAAASFGRESKGQGTGGQGAHDDFDGGQNVRGLRPAAGRDRRRLQIYLRGDAQGRRAARRGRKRRHRFSGPHSRTRRHRRRLDVARIARDRASFREQNAGEIGKAIWPAPLRTD